MQRMSSVLLLSVGCLVGCTHPVTTADPGPESPFARLSRERQAVTISAQRALNDLVNRANLQLAEINGKVYLKRAKLDRVKYFIPLDRGARILSEDMPEALPENAIKKTWSDYASLAHEIHVEYAKPEVIEIETGDSLGYPYTAEVKVRVSMSYRSGLAKQINPPPKRIVLFRQGRQPACKPAPAQAPRRGRPRTDRSPDDSGPG